ncbi:MAG TPA: mersacidin/lichenicidin family type 2 lantibiotic [Ktedonobacteraceae bacterium]|nr:mersacidin/lichenicidin family type 2 lantibiotic [Ktedonobacteraceae bacterium]
MKFDIVRAWKDESYRQSLSEEELKALPPCPAGELSEQELTAIAGGGGFEGEGHNFFNEGQFGLGGTSSSAAFSSHCHSYAVLICDANVFSNDVAVAALQNVLNIGSPRHQVCVHAG